MGTHEKVLDEEAGIAAVLVGEVLKYGPHGPTVWLPGAGPCVLTGLQLVRNEQQAGSRRTRGRLYDGPVGDGVGVAHFTPCHHLASVDIIGGRSGEKGQQLPTPPTRAGLAKRGDTTPTLRASCVA